MLLLHRARKGALLLESDEERRRFQRLLVTLPVEYIARHPESGEIHQGQGILKDFSLSGVFFHSLGPVLLQTGHTLTLTISTPLAPLSQHDVRFIRAQAEVVRLEEPSPDSDYHGVAVSFLDFPCFLNLQNSVNNHC
jgi:c-di-GMP-binding flagellar brake protein YcgR